jgi:hypothetical protein
LPALPFKPLGSDNEYVRTARTQGSKTLKETAAFNLCARDFLDRGSRKALFERFQCMLGSAIKH